MLALVAGCSFWRRKCRLLRTVWHGPISGPHVAIRLRFVRDCDKKYKQSSFSGPYTAVLKRPIYRFKSQHCYEKPMKTDALSCISRRRILCVRDLEGSGAHSTESLRHYLLLFPTMHVCRHDKSAGGASHTITHCRTLPCGDNAAGL